MRGAAAAVIEILLIMEHAAAQHANMFPLVYRYYVHRCIGRTHSIVLHHAVCVIKINVQNIINREVFVSPKPYQNTH